jgi:collagenase-like PrtC family protease
MRDFLSVGESVYLAGADALIVADTGAAAVLRRTFPDLPLHASTQMSGHNLDAAVKLSSLGFERMVVARETSEADMREICRLSPIEIEAFVHGALCVCHSGQCLFSSLVGGRSGNRGLCAQPCRLPYSNSYPLSLKDLSLAEHLPSLIDMGVSSLKIEGRMKPPEYVRAVVGVWRRLLDESRGATPEEMRYLADVFSRQGFTDGYFVGKRDRKMLGIRTEGDKSRSAQTKKPTPATKRNLPPIPEYTERAPATSPYAPLRAKERRGAEIRNTAVFYDFNSYTKAASEFFSLAFIPLEDYENAAQERKAPAGVILPPVISEGEKAQISDMLKVARRLGATDALVGNLGHIDMALAEGFVIHGDFRLNATNNESVASLHALGFADVILSPELTAPRIRDMSGASSVIVYGRIPLMITEKCVGRELGDCKSCSSGRLALTDRRGVKFPVLKVFAHRSMILNSLPTYILDQQKEMRDAYITRRHFLFTTESGRDVDRIINLAREGKSLGRECRRLMQK